jgi:hypothetical protein
MTFDTARAAMPRRKVAWRIMPPVILLYLVAYLDRANVGFAKTKSSACIPETWFCDQPRFMTLEPL